MDFDLANRKRDARLRRRMLGALYHVQRSPTGWVGGRTLFDVVNGATEAEQFESEDHAIGLMREMETIGFARLRTIDRRHSRRFGLDNLELRITPAGAELHQEARPPHPLVEDDRIASEEE